MIKYTIIVKGINQKQEFIKEVQKYLEHGWTLVGGCQSNTYSFIQTLTINIKEEE